MDAPYKIVGDIHAQYFDLLRIFDNSGFPPEEHFLFMEDYVDRGKQGLEVLCLLLCYKVPAAALPAGSACSSVADQVPE